jgi:hypothetical protein
MQPLTYHNTHFPDDRNPNKRKFYYCDPILLCADPRGPHGLRRGSEIARLLGSCVRIPSGGGYLSLLRAVCFQVVVSASG